MPKLASPWNNRRASTSASDAGCGGKIDQTEESRRRDGIDAEVRSDNGNHHVSIKVIGVVAMVTAVALAGFGTIAFVVWSLQSAS